MKQQTQHQQDVKYFFSFSACFSIFVWFYPMWWYSFCPGYHSFLVFIAYIFLFRFVCFFSLSNDNTGPLFSSFILLCVPFVVRWFCFSVVIAHSLHASVCVIFVRSLFFIMTIFFLHTHICMIFLLFVSFAFHARMCATRFCFSTMIIPSVHPGMG
jgi:hypothetical protein